MDITALTRKSSEKKKKTLYEEVRDTAMYNQPVKVTQHQPDASGVIDINANNPTLQKFFGKIVLVNAVGYTRVSTDKQVLDGFSLEVQSAKIKEYAQKNELNLVKIYSDEGISGSDMQIRPSFQQMLNSINDNDIVIVPSISRLGRKTLDMLATVKVLMDHKIKLLLLDMPELNPKNPFGAIQLQFLSTMAEWERTQTSIRVKAVLNSKSRNGTLRSKPRYGYRINIDPKTGEHTVVPNDAEQKVITFMRHLVTEDPGLTVTALCHILDENNIKMRKSKKAHWSTVERIVSDNSIPVNRKARDLVKYET